METVITVNIEPRFFHMLVTTDGSLTMFEMLFLPGGRVPVRHHHRD